MAVVPHSAHRAATRDDDRTVARRGMLRGALALGTAMWVAPFIDSRPASAACPATAKCSPSAISFGASIVSACTPAGVFTRAEITINWTAGGGWCPCGATGNSVCVSILSGVGWTNGALTATKLTTPTNGTLNAAAGTWSFVVQDAGRNLATGTWTQGSPASGFFRIAFKCVDRTGDRVWRIYQLAVNFTNTYVNPGTCVVGVSAGSVSLTVVSDTTVCRTDDICPL